MCRADGASRSPLAAVFLAVALTLGVAGCDSGAPPVATVTLTADAEEVNEGEGREPVAVTLTLSEAVKGAVTITLDVSGGTATLGSDFDLNGDTDLTVAAGSTTATTAVTPIRDLEAEGDETISLEIAAVDGDGEIGTPSSVDIIIRDLGAPPQAPEGDYAAFEALLAIFSPVFDEDAAPLDAIGPDALNFTVLVSNTGTAAASPTRAVLPTAMDVFGPDDGREVGLLPVPALPPEGWFFGDIRVPLSELPPGANLFMLRVEAVGEEDPTLADLGEGGAVAFSGFFVTDGNRIRTTCTGFERHTRPGIPDPLFPHQWSLDNIGQPSFANAGGVPGEDLRMTQTLARGPTGAGVQVGSGPV